jgi:hypothetical protein
MDRPELGIKVTWVGARRMSEMRCSASAGETTHAQTPAQRVWHWIEAGAASDNRHHR